MTAPDCLFCRVVSGQLPGRVVHESDTVVAFLDVAPASRGHTLVVPRVHVVDVWEADPEVLADVARAAHAVAALLRARLAPDGLTLRQNNGAASGQKVDHLHLHLVPRWHGDGTVGWPWPPPQDLDLDEVLADLQT
ncbi:MAG: histidine triad protein [Frankiales bacterium]|nr:histidine triad protein [Frankiales bacterium]